MRHVSEQLPIDPDVKSLILGAQSKEHIALVIDESGSMSSSWQRETKSHIAERAMQTIVGASSPYLTEYSVVLFHNEARIVLQCCSSTLKLHAIKLKPAGGTAMAGAIQTTRTGTNATRHILLSDGHPTDSREQLWSEVAACAAAGIKIDTVAIGDADNTLMEEIARRTGGTFYRAENPQLLYQRFAQLETRAYLQLTQQKEEQ